MAKKAKQPIIFAEVFQSQLDEAAKLCAKMNKGVKVRGLIRNKQEMAEARGHGFAFTLPFPVTAAYAVHYAIDIANATAGAQLRYDGRAKEPWSIKHEGETFRWAELPEWSEFASCLGLDDDVSWADSHDEDFDAEEDDEPDGPKSIVKDTYRKKYKEASGAAHCGDWLATVLDGEFEDENGFNVEAWLSTLNANGVETTGKWAQSRSRGFQGRIRMTGRIKLEMSLLGRKELILPSGSIKISREFKDWLEVKHSKHV